MGVREQILFLGFILFVIIALSLSMPSVMPYHKDSLFSKEYPYEGFSEYVSEESKPNTDPNNSKTEPKDSKKVVDGFEGLQSSPLNSSETIDIFSAFSGKSSCTPSPYSNSQGYLCMNADAIKLLSTRGGNATGNPSQIG
jgi:hypothetical protein